VVSIFKAKLPKHTRERPMSLFTTSPDRANIENDNNSLAQY